MAKLAEDWQNRLTQAQRDAWNVYAQNVSWKNRLNQTVHLTGFAHFTRSNAPRIQQGIAERRDAPVIFNLAPPEQALGAYAEQFAPELDILFDDTPTGWVIENGAHQLVYLSRPTNPSQKFYGGPWTFWASIAGNAIVPPTRPILGVLPGYYAAGQRLRFRSRISRADGRLSDFAYAETIVIV